MKSKGLLELIETAGNKLPHPLMLFIYLTLITIVLSFVVSWLGISAVSPTTQETIFVKNLLSFDTLVDLFQNSIKNFQNFPVLGIVVMLALSSGFAEKVGFFKTIISMFLRNTKGNKVVYISAFIAVCTGILGDSAFLVTPIILAAVFKGVGRNPIAGILMGYACVGVGIGTAALPGPFDVILTPLTLEYAHLMDPSYSMTYISGYYIVFVSSFITTAIAGFVTIKYIEPKLKTLKPQQEMVEENAEQAKMVKAQLDDDPLTDEKIRAAKKALWAMAAFVLFLVVLCLPESSPFRSESGSLIDRAPLMFSMHTIIILLFFIPAYVYAKGTGQVKNVTDVANVLTEAAKGVAPFIVLAVVISQFLVLFAQSNMGTVLAINGGNFLKASALPVSLILVLFMLLTSMANIFIISGSTKYLILGPVFVPMLMQVGIDPAFTQVLYRFGDSMTNHFSPLNAFFVIVLILVQKYDKNIGLGTLFSFMIPYAIGYVVSLVLLVLLWFFLNLTPGVGSAIFL